MACNWKERLSQIEQRKKQLLGEVNNPETTQERMTQIETESADLAKEEKEVRSRWHLSNALITDPDPAPGAAVSGQATESPIEQRAKQFRSTNKLTIPMFAEQRSLLVSSGKIAAPTAVYQTIGELPTVVSSIVDDVEAIDATGTGAWDFPYKKTDAEAADVTEGSEIGGTGATYDKVTIKPGIWGVLDEISNQVAKMTNVAYTANVQNSAYLALRKKARDKIVAKIKASGLTETRESIALDENYLRTVTLGYGDDENVIGGETKLYINKTDLDTLGKVRGSDKKPVYDITFTDSNNGIIKDGGLATKFSLTKLTTGEQIYGNARTVKMLMWGDYEVSTDQGGDYFKRNMMGVRGLETADADLAVWHGMQLIKQAGG